MAEPITTDSEVVRVTFFEDRAEVVRRARRSVPAGVSWVTLGGVSASLDDASLVASVGGDDARAIAARVRRHTRDADDGSARAEAEQQLRAAHREESLTGRAIARAESSVERARTLQAAWLDGLRRVPRGDGDPEAALAHWETAWTAYDQAVTRGFTALGEADGAYERAVDERVHAAERVAKASAVTPRREAEIEVQVETREAREVEVEVTYRTPCALWRPEHLARLVTRDGRREIELRTWATVWQRTGERWEGVPCRFSTARPASAATAPLLRDDVLVLRRKSEQERRTVTVEAREQSVSMAGLDRGTRAVNEMPGVDDGGEALWFDAERPATIPSDGAPVRVTVARATVPCEVDRVAMPERSAAVHVRATATLRGERPLLAGPVTVARGGEVAGRGRVGFVGRGEPFELGFGVDDGLRVRRHVDEKREVATITGAQKVTRTVRLYVSNLSGDARRLTVTERVPVSEVKDVEVTLVQTAGARHDARDGFLRWELDVPPRGTQELTLVYRIEAAAKVSLPA